MSERSKSALDCEAARHGLSHDTSSVPAGPVRTCVGCRQRESPSALVRTVAVVSDAGDVRIVVDQRRRMPGRGAWLHPRQDCLQQAERRRALGRALRVTGPVDLSELVREFALHQADD
ncbi:MAG: YlxR family protein [Rhodococcus sp. (in: high G+C Gram-positive bacteria)]